MQLHRCIKTSTRRESWGSRNASANAVTFCEKLSRDLATEGIAVISGLARGIDAAAHRGALDGGTIAIVGGGIDRIYPRENESLYREIAERGLIIAEMPFGMQPLARHFPVRNRLIASLAAGLVVVEAGMRSGSLISAREAGERGREVMAIPGAPIDPRSQGCNILIREGATLVRSAADIMDAVRRPELLASPRKQRPAGGGEIAPTSAQDCEKARIALRNVLGYEASEVDELIRQCHYPAAAVHSALLQMELAGEITRHFGNRVSLVYENESET